MDSGNDVAALAAEPMNEGGNEVGAADAEMDVDHDDAAPQTAVRAGKHKYSQKFKDKILALLEESGFADKRSAKLSQDEFMQLLAAFNSRGIHFA